jgi:L-glyceraldehyde 3-phosphate reductase
MFDRWIEDGLLNVLNEEGIGCIVFSPLAQGLLTNKYLKNIPEDSRAAKPHGFLQKDAITPETLDKVRRLNDIAGTRGQTLAQMAIAWVLRHPNMTSALVGASSVKQVEDNITALRNLDFDHEQLQAIETILAG